MRRYGLALALFVAASLGACIIGPKHDDPSADLVGGTGADAGSDSSVAEDTSGSDFPDVAVPTSETGKVSDDAASDVAKYDGATDAGSDGSAEDASDAVPSDANDAEVSSPDAADAALDAAGDG